MNPEYPVYIISKGRHESRQTARTLEEIGVPYHIVIEPQEFKDYSKVINPAKILKLPFSNLGQGSIPARNWVWEHSISIGAKRHWILDDNIRHFYRLNKNIKFKVTTGAIFKAAEDFVDRYENVPMAGFQYELLCPRKDKRKPFRINNRVYSCILLDCSLPMRWRGRYNEDTDLSIRIMKEGLCTILFEAFLCGKTATMTMKGGNTDSLYRQGNKIDGRLEMARHLQRQHPDIVKVVRKFGRWQHSVDYRRFRNNKLIKKPGEHPTGINNYGMKAVKIA